MIQVPVTDQMIVSYDSNAQLAKGLAEYSKVELMSVVVIQNDESGKASAVAYGLGKPKKMSTKPSGEKTRDGSDLFEFEIELQTATGRDTFKQGTASGFVQAEVSNGVQIAWAQDAVDPELAVQVT